MVTGRFTNKTTPGQSRLRLVNSWTRQLAKMFDGKF